MSKLIGRVVRYEFKTEIVESTVEESTGLWQRSIRGGPRFVNIPTCRFLRYVCILSQTSFHTISMINTYTYDVGQILFPDIQIMRIPISHINEIVLPLSNRILV